VFAVTSNLGVINHVRGLKANTVSPALPPRSITAQRHRSCIPQILTNMDKLHFGSSPRHAARQFGDPVSAFGSQSVAHK